MFKVPFFDSEPARPRIPDGICVYAVGDIHGRIDLLDRLLARIDADRADRPVVRAIEVFLGDYVDRGQDSAGVLERLISRGQSHETICLLGNHEDCLLEFFTNPGILTAWSQNGGLTTLLSYGLRPSIQSSPEEQRELSAALAAAMPASHRRFLTELPLSFTCGDYFFVHAGVRPGVPLARQREEDLLWIREEFLRHEAAFEKVIVHGHTPVREPDVRANRIDIDTGAYATGRLTCLRLEHDEITFI
jgi:serine/threonine protein phosphatase 1